jgi:biotin transport system substrate-specific component
LKIRSLILAALFAALTAIGAFIQIPMVPVPITLQLLFCIVAGMLLGPGLGALSQVLYIAIGLLGLPIFAGGGGLGYILKPSFGYLLGFAAGSFTCGLIVRQFKSLTFLKALLASMAGVIVVYAIGVPYLYIAFNAGTPGTLTFGKALATGAVVFLPGDVLKCVVAALIAVLVRPVLLRQRIL